MSGPRNAAQYTQPTRRESPEKTCMSLTFTQASQAQPPHPVTDRVREAMATSLRGCDDLLPETDWLAKLARSEATGVPLRVKFGLDAQALLAMAEKERIAAFVIGLPINMDGSAGPRAQATRAFVHNMAQKTDLPFIYWDERLSTVAAERVLIEMDVSRKKRADRIDSAAASFILQGALDRLASLAKDAAATSDG